MVAAQFAYSKGRTFARRVSAAFAVFFGLFALLFTATPKLWNSDSSGQNTFTNFFTQNTAHADTPHSCGGGGGGGGGADSGGASGCAGACADGSAGSCACGDGGGCGTGGATA